MSYNLDSTRKRPREDEEDRNLHQHRPPHEKHENISAHDHARQHNGDRYHGNVNIYHGGGSVSRSPEPTFLWAVPVVGILNDECSRGNVQKIRSRLKIIPTALTDLIQDILNRDKPSKYLVPLLQWVLFSRRRMRSQELFLSLQSIEPETYKIFIYPRHWLVIKSTNSFTTRLKDSQR